MTISVQARPPARLSSRERLELILNHIDQLPTLPAVAARLLAVTSSDESSACDVVELIESDAALTAAILRMARRADLGVRSQGLTVERAVTLLGFNRVRNAALSVQVFDTLSNPDADSRATEILGGVWQHSLAVACTAEAIAERLGGRQLAGEAFVCGLLHDIGKVALGVSLPKSYVRVVDEAQRRHDCICDVERRLLGLDHTMAGKRLAERWRLPDAVVESVWLHHQSPDALPASVVFRKLVGIVHLSDHLVRREGVGYSGYVHVGDINALAGRLDTPVRVLADIMEKLPERIEPFRELIALEDHGSRENYASSLVKANFKLAALNTQLIEANRNLDLRSQCLTALERFTNGLSDAHRIGEVCVAAAAGMRMLLHAEAAMAFCAEVEGRCIHVGQVNSDTPEGVAAVVDLGESDDTLAWHRALTDLSSKALTPAPHGFETIWTSCHDTLPPKPLWLLPFEAMDGISAGVLVSASEEAVRPFRSSAGHCASLTSVMGLAICSARTRTVSERLNDELLDLNRRLRAAQQEIVRTRSISMIGAMAAGAAHELNNPLSVISGRAQMELAECDNPESARAFRIIIEQTERITDIVDDLINFSKPKPPTPVLLPLAGLLEPLCQHWRASYSLRDEQITVQLADDQVAAYADGGQLHEILNAIVANAVMAMDLDSARLQINSPSRASDETVRIVVEDNGTGMTPEALEHAFDPFFSERPAGRGRGLGLSQAYRLVENQGGRLSIESTPEVGTTVTIELPARAPAN